MTQSVAAPALSVEIRRDVHFKSIHCRPPLNYAAHETQATGLILQASALAQSPRIRRSAGWNTPSLCGGQLDGRHRVFRK
jgi:hypothetical protein